MTARVTILGCTGSYPAAGTACSGYLLRAADDVVLFDAGPGTLANLQHHVALEELTAVVLSHHHPDHWSDFGVLRTAWRYGLEREGLPVLGPPELHGVALHMVGHDLAPTIAWEDTTDGHETQVGSLALRFSRTDHYVDTMAVRIDGDGWSLAYSADTGPAWSVAALGDAIDTFLCEATLLDAERAGADEQVLHLTAAEAGRMARVAGVGRLLLTHQPPGADLTAFAAEAAAAFGAPVEVVREGATYELHAARG